MKTVFHLHTEYSKDASLSIDKLLKITRSKGVDCLIVTDHNTTRGAEKLARIAPLKIVIGEEIATKEGEIIGLFLKKEIPKGMSLEKTILEIKNQGGLVCLPHPFDRLRKKVLKRESIEKYIDQIDIIEIFNSRTVFPKDNKKAQDFAYKKDKLVIVGADAHTPWEIGSTYFEIDDFDGSKEFLSKLRNAQFYTKKTNVLVHFLTFLTKLKARLKEKFQKF
jgi:predicted metal-dependent phosphoesterase TrpH